MGLVRTRREALLTLPESGPPVRRVKPVNRAGLAVGISTGPGGGRDIGRRRSRKSRV